MTRPPGRRAAVAQGVAGRREAAERRKLVLAHPDLAARLTRPPLDYKTPDQWSGHIPPLMIEGPYDPRSPRGAWIRNPSPQRIHLVAIVREAYARTCGEPVAKAWLEEINTSRWTDDWSPHDALRRATAALDRHTPDWAKETP